MQIFRILLAHVTGRTLGLVLAYLLVAHALLAPHRALSAIFTKSEIMPICNTVSALIGPSEEGVLTREEDGIAHKKTMHSDCEIGCLKQNIYNKNFISQSYVIIAIIDNKNDVNKKQYITNTRNEKTSMRALIKSPRAPPYNYG
jgi:hypothetical protein